MIVLVMLESKIIGMLLASVYLHNLTIYLFSRLVFMI